MKEMAINKASWHYWVATELGGFKPKKHLDFCAYVRRFLLGMLGAFVLSCIGAFILYLVASLLFFGYLFITTGHIPKEGWFGVGIMLDAIIGGVIAVFAVVIALAVGVERLKEYLRETKKARQHEQYLAAEAYYQEHGKYPEVQDGFLTEAYRSFKQKTCYRLRVE
jgi:hypothetical protein